MARASIVVIASVRPSPHLRADDCHRRVTSSHERPPEPPCSAHLSGSGALPGFGYRRTVELPRDARSLRALRRRTAKWRLSADAQPSRAGALVCRHWDSSDALLRFHMPGAVCRNCTSGRAEGGNRNAAAWTTGAMLGVTIRISCAGQWDRCSWTLTGDRGMQQVRPLRTCTPGPAHSRAVHPVRSTSFLRHSTGCTRCTSLHIAAPKRQSSPHWSCLPFLT